MLKASVLSALKSNISISPPLFVGHPPSMLFGEGNSSGKTRERSDDFLAHSAKNSKRGSPCLLSRAGGTWRERIVVVVAMMDALFKVKKAQLLPLLLRQKRSTAVCHGENGCPVWRVQKKRHFFPSPLFSSLLAKTHAGWRNTDQTVWTSLFHTRK